ncbi:hypothetical protein Syun_022224 [Stephania yunnanensis]|uniref:Protein kinase domain-containing protein n=1 Tax=Stephania yunnanensis TaxID=152371 RepID=A0AAP0IJ15_9MAGN
MQSSLLCFFIMDCVNLATFRDKFHRLLIITTFVAAVSILKPVLSANSLFNACEPKKCGENVRVEYPFWISSQHPSSCGNPFLEIDCVEDKHPTIKLSGDHQYEILDINYENGSLLVADADAFDEKACVAPSNNFTLSEEMTTMMSLSPYDLHLYFFYDCTLRPTDYPTYHIPCRVSKTNSHNFAALLIHNSTLNYLNASAEKCESIVAAPVYIDEGVVDPGTLDRMNYTSILQEGFLLNWSLNTRSSCDACRQSKGRCGQIENQFMCFCSDHNDTRSCDDDGGRPGLSITIGILIVAAFVVVPVVGVSYLLRRRSKNHPNVEELLRNHLSLSPKRYKYYDVRKMTNSFKEKLGQGGYGSVFKGQLLDGRLVAVKVLDKTNKGDGEDLVNEIASISRTSHVNVVALLGFCIEGPKRALIYEFMPNGSLEKFIYNDKLSKTGFQHHQQLGWDTLFKITIGIARGLEYLHRGCYTRIVHFDIKPHNILLDQDFNPKISDFGLSKLCLKKESTMSTMGARGTIGYIAPELVLRAFGKVSHKSDVYSYGMMVLEMVGQRKNVDAAADNTSEIYFPHWIYKRLDQLEELGLGTTTTEDEKELARKMTIVGLWCIQVDPMQRPSMNKVLDMLVGRIEDLEIPPMPTFSSSAPSVHQETCSSISVS